MSHHRRFLVPRRSAGCPRSLSLPSSDIRCCDWWKMKILRISIDCSCENLDLWVKVFFFLLFPRFSSSFIRTQVCPSPPTHGHKHPVDAGTLSEWVGFDRSGDILSQTAAWRGNEPLFLMEPCGHLISFNTDPHHRECRRGRSCLTHCTSTKLLAVWLLAWQRRGMLWKSQFTLILSGTSFPHQDLSLFFLGRSPAFTHTPLPTLDRLIIRSRPQPNREVHIFLHYLSGR